MQSLLEKEKYYLKKRNNLFIFILTGGVFGVLNTEMGMIGILPFMADKFKVSISQAGLLVSLFALCILNYNYNTCYVLCILE